MSSTFHTTLAFSGILSVSSWISYLSAVLVTGISVFVMQFPFFGDSDRLFLQIWLLYVIACLDLITDFWISCCQPVHLFLLLGINILHFRGSFSPLRSITATFSKMCRWVFSYFLPTSSQDWSLCFGSPFTTVFDWVFKNLKLGWILVLLKMESVFIFLSDFGLIGFGWFLRKLSGNAYIVPQYYNWKLILTFHIN